MGGGEVTSSISFRIPSKALRALAPSSRVKPPFRVASLASSCNRTPYDSSASARACARDNSSSFSTQPFLVSARPKEISGGGGVPG
jgi:hypothetical protein